MTTEKQSKYTLILSIIIAVLMLLLFFKGCKRENEIIKVSVPAVSGTTTVATPSQEPIVITKDSIVFVKIPVVTTKDYKYWQSEANRIAKEYDIMNEAFANANDSLQQIIYANAIQPNEYFNEFDNDTINAQVFGTNTGQINSMQLKYTIKQRKQEAKVPQTDFRLLGGIEIGNSKTFEQFNTKANLGFQNKKGNIITVAVDTDQRFYVGYQFSIFSLKK